MVLHGSAIRPVPPFARVRREILEEIERELGRDGDEARAELDLAFGRFERTQPQLAERIGGVLSGQLEEPALALGYFLSIVVWLAFERSFGARLAEVAADELLDTLTSLNVEEELVAQRLRAGVPPGVLLERAQPDVASFVGEHVAVALEASGVDARGVHLVHRAVVELSLALSFAVAPAGHVEHKPD